MSDHAWTGAVADLAHSLTTWLVNIWACRRPFVSGSRHHVYENHQSVQTDHRKASTSNTEFKKYINVTVHNQLSIMLTE